MNQTFCSHIFVEKLNLKLLQNIAHLKTIEVTIKHLKLPPVHTRHPSSNLGTLPIQTYWATAFFASIFL